MKRRRNIMLLWVVATVLLVASCSKENAITPEGGNGSGNFVRVTLPFAAGSTETPATEAAATKSAAGEISRNASTDNAAEGFSVSFGNEALQTAPEAEPRTGTPASTEAATATSQAPATRTLTQEMTNLWVLQFNSSGKNVSTTNVGTLAAGADLTVPSLEVGAGYTIYIVANGPASGLTTANPATLTAFESTMLHTAEVTDAAKLPLSGKLSGVTVADMGNGNGKVSIPGSEFPVVTLNRIHAEVNLTVDVAVTGYTLTGAQLYNVPLGATYGWNSATKTFPKNTVAANFGSAAGMLPLTTTISGTTTSYKWFVGDNRRGDVTTLTAVTDRHRGKAPAYATFARITLLNNTESTQKLYYDLYLGSGAVTNFDVKRNMTYTQTAAIKGSAAFHEALFNTDARVSNEDVGVYLTDNQTDSPFVISPQNMESTTSLKWGPTTPTGVTDIYDGKGNTDRLMTLSATAYPAAKYCRDKGAEWHLPSQAQLMLMWAYLPAIPANKRPLLLGNWSSTEYFGITSEAWYVSFTYGNSSYYTKEPHYDHAGVRCITSQLGATTDSWKYPKVENGNTIVSRDAATGIKSQAILTDVQKIWLRTTNSSTTTYDDKSDYNRVSAKFEVASVDASKGTTWAGAYAACKHYSQGAFGSGSWRLPTQRELMLIWMFKAKLTGCGDIKSADVVLWSSTNFTITSSSAWYIVVSNGNSYGLSQNNNYSVRCVRDI